MPDVVSFSFVRPEGFEQLSPPSSPPWCSRESVPPKSWPLPSAVAPAQLSLAARYVLAQRWSDRPGTREPRRNLSPGVAARSKWSRIEALLRNRAFRDAYTAARASFAAGIRDVIFPAGTYWLRRFTRAICAPWPEPA